jgi:cytoskeletal protein CcmA (bactofilin family)
MKSAMKLLTLFLLLALAVLPSSNAQAKGLLDGKVVFGQDFVLEKGKTLSGDLVVFGGNVSIEEDATVKGSVVVFGGNTDMAEGATIERDVAMFGGNMQVNGRIKGSAVVMGGQIYLGKTAVVNGDVSAIGGQVDRDPGAKVEGKIVENIPAPTIDIPSSPESPEVPNLPDVSNPPKINIQTNPMWEAFNVVLRALVVAGLGMLLTLFLQPQLERVADAIVRQPVLAGSFGLLTAVLTPMVMLVMIVTLILIPVAALVALLLPLTWLFGVIALGQEVGERFTRSINQTWAPVLTTGFGTFLLLLVGGYIGMIPCVGWLVPVLIALIGVGGVMMTWFGTRLAPGSPPQPVEVPPAS